MGAMLYMFTAPRMSIGPFEQHPISRLCPGSLMEILQGPTRHTDPIENCRNANFVITVIPAICHHNDHLGDDNVGIMTTLGFQCNGIPNT